MTILETERKKETILFDKEIMPSGVVNFPSLTEPANTGFNPGKLTVTLKMPKGEGCNDDFAETVNSIHTELGGDGQPVKDGDEYKPEYNMGCWVAIFKCSEKYPLKGFDEYGRVLDLVEFEFGDTARVTPSLYDYSDSKASGKGVTTYFKGIQMVEKGSGAFGGMPALKELPEDEMPAVKDEAKLSAEAAGIIDKVKSRQAATKAKAAKAA